MLNKDFLINACDDIFNSDLGKKIEASAMSAVSDYSMEKLIRSGVAVGFSGGADSVLLLIFLRKLKKLWNFPLIAVHVNHSIRGDDANDDENFAKSFARALDVDFISYTVDVPRLAKEFSKGLEEAARDVRYELFEKTVKEIDRINVIATAHNSTDNLETMLFNLMRGTGIAGLCGISPVRDNVIRPLIEIAKEDITDLLDSLNIPYSVDKTNFSTEYSRNYIRHEIIPKLKRLNASPETAATKASKNLRADAEFISKEANAFFERQFVNGKIRTSELLKLDGAVFSRVVCLMAKKNGSIHPEKVHIDKIKSLLKSNPSFEVALPGQLSFFGRSDFSYIAKSEKEEIGIVKTPVFEGFNVIPESDFAIGISKNKNEFFSSNVYKFSIQADLSSAIILGRLYVRSKEDGDSYFYGGITHKLKKLFNDRKIPPEKRSAIPVVCDEKGIVWVPGFGVRDDGGRNDNFSEHKWITLYTKNCDFK